MALVNDARSFGQGSSFVSRNRAKETSDVDILITLKEHQPGIPYVAYFSIHSVFKCEAVEKIQNQMAAVRTYRVYTLSGEHRLGVVRPVMLAPPNTRSALKACVVSSKVSLVRGNYLFHSGPLVP